MSREEELLKFRRACDALLVATGRPERRAQPAPDFLRVAAEQLQATEARAEDAEEQLAALRTSFQAFREDSLRQIQDLEDRLGHERARTEAAIQAAAEPIGVEIQAATRRAEAAEAAEADMRRLYDEALQGRSALEQRAQAAETRLTRARAALMDGEEIRDTPPYEAAETRSSAPTTQDVYTDPIPLIAMINDLRHRATARPPQARSERSRGIHLFRWRTAQ